MQNNPRLAKILDRTLQEVGEGEGLSGVARFFNTLNITQDRIFRRAFLDFYLDGNAFFYYDKESLYLLPANDVEVVADSKTFISHYNYLIYPIILPRLNRSCNLLRI